MFCRISALILFSKTTLYVIAVEQIKSFAIALPPDQADKADAE